VSTAYTAFLPYVLPGVYGCPDTAAEQAVRDTCIDFCKRTDLVQVILTPVDIVANQEDYTAVMPTGTQMARLLGVAWQGKWLTPVAPDDVQSDVALRGVTIGTAVPAYGDPGYFFQKTPETNVVSLYPIPNTALVAGLTIKVSTYPTITSTTVDDQLFNEWHEEIAQGAIARLQATPGQPFSGNPLVARAVYERGISKAKAQKMFGKTQAPSRVQGQKFM
jgi:hypothetical protein